MEQTIDPNLIRRIVADVLEHVVAEQGLAPATKEVATTMNNHSSMASHSRTHGVFSCVDDAVAAAKQAFDELSTLGMRQRKRITDIIRSICKEQAEELGTLEFNETRVGRLEHKIEKLRILADHLPGVEFLQSQVFSGDFGLTVIEPAPFGVIGIVTPVTHSLPTLAANAIAMIAAGNTVVANPHPSGKRIAAEGVRRFNQALFAEFGIDNLICVIEEPTIESADHIFKHRDVAIICVTGGPAVARAALRSGKRAIVAGPGNPPVVVDETADIARAARCIIDGASYDNNLLCIGEKQVFVVDSVADQLMLEMQKCRAVKLTAEQFNRLTDQAIKSDERNHYFAVKDFVGQDASFLANAVGITVPNDTPLLFAEAHENHPLVLAEQMMPCLPIVRCRNANHAIDCARISEHGFRHTSIIHSNSVKNMTRMGQLLDTTIFVKNGPSTAGNGIGGEGYFSYSIAGPTGEGVTTPLTFTRQRRCALIEGLRIVGKPVD
ncbi:MAG TPA: aldehyde dehydrogenase EutE [Pirellulaceae bacterium]|nr:aldehyde dehydrogenase EutE [Pirellulaceae bacterium]HMO91437.1 aldehyde dehydrogenase EutE [Pirellulaceae bacterium]HMP69486.1 aldehyde dehydrogenase EutE [Pirellulaceae bacterium]